MIGCGRAGGRVTPAGLGGSRRGNRAVAGLLSSFLFCRLILGWPVFILFLFIPLLEWGVIVAGVRAHGALGGFCFVCRL